MNKVIGALLALVIPTQSMGKCHWCGKLVDKATLRVCDLCLNEFCPACISLADDCCRCRKDE